MKLPLVSGEKMCKIVSGIGFKMVHQTGSHTVWKRASKRVSKENSEGYRALGRWILEDEINMWFKLNREMDRPPTHIKTTVMLNAPEETIRIAVVS